MMPRFHCRRCRCLQTPGALNRVVSLQLTAFWQRHSGTIMAVGGGVLCYAIWRAMYRTSQVSASRGAVRAPCAGGGAVSGGDYLVTVCGWWSRLPGSYWRRWRHLPPPFLLAAPQLFVTLSDTMAASGFLATAASTVAFGFLYLRRRYNIDPQQVYRLAQYRLNTHPGLLEVRRRLRWRT